MVSNPTKRSSRIDDERDRHTELNGESLSGYPVVGLLLALQFLAALPYLWMEATTVAVVASGLVLLFGWGGLYVIAPNQGMVLQLFGTYKGTDRSTGLRWNNPFYTKQEVSLRIRNFESGQLKVNDANGSPIEIAAVIVWRVIDTAEAVFEVDNYEDYVSIQSEAALRNLATHYPYEHEKNDKRITLRGHSNTIARRLKEEVQERLGKAGVYILEARISHLAYSQEIAQAMLQRQQATAVLAARRLIVQGAVGMVKDAVEQLDSENIVELDNERKAVMVSNLLVVLCGEHSAQPIVNAGSIC